MTHQQTTANLLAAAMPYGSKTLEDSEFVRLFEMCDYPGERFQHADHLRLAWIYVRCYGPEAAERRIAENIRRFATNLGHPEKYHDSITRAWVRLVWFAHSLSPRLESFETFAAAHGWLLNRQLLDVFYTPECLASSAARQGWVPPDVRALPS